MRRKAGSGRKKERVLFDDLFCCLFFPVNTIATKAMSVSMYKLTFHGQFYFSQLHQEFISGKR